MVNDRALGERLLAQVAAPILAGQHDRKRFLGFPAVCSPDIPGACRLWIGYAPKSLLFGDLLAVGLRPTALTWAISVAVRRIVLALLLADRFFVRLAVRLDALGMPLPVALAALVHGSAASGVLTALPVVFPLLLALLFGSHSGTTTSAYWL